MTSIRGRLLGWLSAGLLALFAGAGLLIDRAVGDRLDSDLHTGLDAFARTLAAGLELEIDPLQRTEAQRLGALAMPDPNRTDAERDAARRKLFKLVERAFRIRFVLDPASFPAADFGGEAQWFHVIDGQGNTLARSRRASPPNEPIEVIEATAFPSPEGFRSGEASNDLVVLGQVVHRHVREVPDVRFRDSTWHATWSRLRGDDPGLRKSAWVLVAQSRGGVDRLRARVRAGLLASGIALAVLIALTSWWVVRRGLAPVTQLSEQMGALDARSLGNRIDEAGLPRELLPIAHRLNEALDRIEHSVERERLTAAHIAHELRTPIAELRSITEIAKKWPEETELQARAVADSHDVALHMSRVVSALLKVARAGTGEAALALESLDIVPIVRTAWEGLGAAAADRSQHLEDALPPSLTVPSDRDVAEAVVSSLLKNAIQHAPAGSTIRVGGTTAEGRAALTIGNPAPDLGEQDVAHLAEAFWRKDAARTHSDEGGLGLTLAFELCRSANIELRPALVDGHLVLTLAFPPD